MKEVVVHPLPTLTTEIHDIPIPTPAQDELLIKVNVAGSNPKDWSHITMLKLSMNSGDDVAGTVEAIGADVTTFKIGDRVAGFHKMLTPGGAYAEYAIVPAHTAFSIPDNISFEEAATIPLVTLTAGISLFRRQHLTVPWLSKRADSPVAPLIVYGASSALGSFAIKLALLSNIHPIIAIGSPSSSHLHSLLDEKLGDQIVDHRQGAAGWRQEIVTALGKNSCSGGIHALDAISSDQTWVPLAQLLGDLAGPEPAVRPLLSVVSGRQTYEENEIPSIVGITYTYVGTAHEGAYRPNMPRQPRDAVEVRGDVEFARALMEYVGRKLATGEFSGHPYEIVPGGLAGVGVGLNKLKAGEARGKKFVYRIYETQGIKSN
ncbi:hypothetical protein SERLA73DRAFT_122396 [Serpula lacrymans var. lacrymans S7.3]|uniref:Enoyl reductase (ER) domain-containing protein n=2 Tax=Serpula lacrymans var. lacrymans TaxID=341189 RepID=F8PWN6_SERL3|nr:uncharacterized protein SERLADRAFT_466761 [Serpula lacrymans var. lacrymans S7.9]EGO00360.1 hypothetical protein SERLA73DRAFT_122396 [Serpula lacrymans var. lacrymans S7.3]EGO25920.1 hypothetical protein SERLADRAFT_466761 [Serpula lacrymans var. lacrymans S7.9]